MSEQSAIPLESVGTPRASSSKSRPRSVTDNTHSHLASKQAAETQGVNWVPQWTAPSREDAVNEFLGTYTEEDKAGAWQESAEIIKGYSDEMVARWIAEMDNLLVFSGLFSAVLTTLVAQTYPDLQPGSPDQTLAVLQQISLQLASFSVNQPFVNSTRPAFTSTDETLPAVSSSTVVLNTLWFSALILSLSTALVAIMVKQWLSEFRSGLSGTSLDVARLRQYRLNNVERWHVGDIVAILPVLLEVSLVLFLVGLLVLLRDLHPTVAIVATILISVTFVIMAVTTLLPVFWRDCCYLSGPTFFVATVGSTGFNNFVKPGLDALVSLLAYAPDSRTSLPAFRKTLGKFHDRYMRQFGPTAYRGSLVWSLRERSLVRSSSARLDADMIYTAYSYTADLRYLAGAAAINLVTLPSAVAIRCFRRILGLIHLDSGFVQRGGSVSMDADMRRISALSYKFWIAAMYQAMYLPEALVTPIKLLIAVNKPSAGGVDVKEETVFDARYRQGVPSATLVPWDVGRHVSTAIQLTLDRRRTHKGPASLTRRLDEVLFNAFNLMIGYCMTSLLSPDTTGARGKEAEVRECAQATIVQLKGSLALQRRWTSGMLSAVASILERVHESDLNESNLLTNDLLNAALDAARASAEDVDNMDAAQRLETVVERHQGTSERPVSHSFSSSGADPTSRSQDSESHEQLFYVDEKRMMI